MRSLLWALVATANISLTFAQSSPSGSATVTTGSTASSTSSRPPATFTVEVGVQHAFRPDTIVANPGDTIRFEFLPTNHSVVKADFRDPCVPFEYHRKDEPTFFSGPKLSKTGDDRPVWTLLINDTKPTFFYCSAPESCLTWKMIGVINPNSTWSLQNQLLYHANTTKFQLSPGEDFPDEAPKTTSATSISTSTSTSTSSAAATSTSSTSSESSGGGGTSLGAGAIAGIAIGGVAVLIIGALVVWFCGRRGGIEKGYRRSAAVHPPPPVVEAHYDNDPKSPGFQNSHYPSGVPVAAGQHDAFRAASPSQWSHSQPLNSPHTSYLGQPTSPAPYGPSSPLMTGQEQQHTGSTYYSEHPKPVEQPAVELPVGDYQHPSELDSTPTQYQSPPAQYNPQQPPRQY